MEVGDWVAAVEALVERLAVEVVVGCGEVMVEGVRDEYVKTDKRISRRRMRVNNIISMLNASIFASLSVGLRCCNPFHGPEQQHPLSPSHNTHLLSASTGCDRSYSFKHIKLNVRTPLLQPFRLTLFHIELSMIVKGLAG